MSTRTREDAKKTKQERKLQAQQKAAAKPPTPAARPKQGAPEVQLSKALAYILRHGAQKEHIHIRSDGYVRVSDILARPKIQKITMPGDHAPDLADIEHVVSSNAKKRFELSSGTDEGPGDGRGPVLWIRAVQGHSLEDVKDVSTDALTLDNVALHLPLRDESTGDYMAIHGTQAEAWDHIRASHELRRMGRNHIHMAQGLPGDSGVISGMRNSSTHLLYISVSAALRDGIPFAMASNGVVLSSGAGDTGALPLTYVLRVTDRHGHTIWPA